MLLKIALFCVLVAGGISAQQGPPKRGAENRDAGSYNNYDQQYQQPYQNVPYPYNNGGHKYDIGNFFADIQLPSVNDVVTGIVYVLAVASVAGLVLIGVFLFLKVLGLKLPIIADLKKQVLSKVDKVDARMLESAWDMLQNAYNKYQQL